MTESDQHRARLLGIRRVLLVELGLNIAVCIAKAVYGWASGSMAILADAAHSLVDGVANIAGFVLIGAASAPADADHPYGHRKIEVVAAAVLGLLIAGTAISFGRDAVTALLERREPPAGHAIGFWVIGATLLVNIGVAVYERRKARELDSAYLAADAAHTATDVMVTLGVLASFAASREGIWWADPVGALVVLLVIGRVSWRILRENISVLIDSVAVDAEIVRNVAVEHERVIDCHRVRSRGPRDAVLVDLHLVVSGELLLADAHAVAHQVEEAIVARLPGVIEVVVHVEPEGEEAEPL